MKRTVTIIAALFLMLGAQAQFGLTAGPTMSKFYFGYDRDIAFKVGFVGGIYDRIYLGKHFSIQPELLYHSKGTLINYDPSEDRSRPRDQWRMNLNYVTLPVSINLHLGNFSVGGGAYIARLVKFNNRKWNYDNPAATYDVHLIKPNDWGYIANMSYDCHGMIFEISGSLGQPIIGKDGGVFSRADVTNEYAHVYKNAALNVMAKLPLVIHGN